MNIIYTRQAEKAISRIDNPAKQRIRFAIERLPSGDLKKLKGYTNTYRLRVGDYRVIFDIDTEIIITDILPRGDAYKKQ